MSLGEYTPNSSTKLLLHLNGNSTDSSGNSNNGTDTAITYSQANGKFGQGAGFNGSSSKIATTLNLGTVHTISFWLDYKNASDAVVIGGADNGVGRTDFCPYIDGSSSGSSIYYRPAIISAVSPVSVVHGGLSGMTNITIVRNGTSVSFYKSGSQIGTTQTLSDNNSLTITNLGCINGNALFFNGNLDEVIIENRAWSASEVSKYYTMTKGRFGII